ncbi:MAG: ATP-dependent 6-phosphofructokinase [bacterium]
MDMTIDSLGEARVPSPLQWAVNEKIRIPYHIARQAGVAVPEEITFETAGPRAKIFFHKSEVKAAIVTCGGLCPGLNNVIRSIYYELTHAYGVQEVYGFLYGYQGLDPNRGGEPMRLTSEFVDPIHRRGGTVLGTSRGPVDPAIAIDNLIRRGINMLFCVGGDGTQRGANALHHEAERRGYPLAVVGIPKTIDNDVGYVARTFGYLTAVQEVREILDCAHQEARSVFNGISLVKVMGRHAGFIAAGATIASQDVNFTLVPEVPFALEGPGGFLEAVKTRILRRAHAVIVVAEGAGQDLMAQNGGAKDASGNLKLEDIGVFLKVQIETYFKKESVPLVFRYFDPSYVIRSQPANPEDSILCDLYARNAVHAAMAGKTGLVIGYLHDRFIHVPVEASVAEKKCLDPAGDGWRAVLAATGQPARFA